MTGDTIFEVTDLSVGYRKRDRTINKVVHEVSFDLQRGRILGLAGESGSGKSTTALAAIGYQAPGLRILGGESVLDGYSMLGLPTKKLRSIWGSRAAYVAQNATLALNPAMTVSRQLLQPMSAHLGLRGKPARARALELLEAVGLPDPVAAMSRYPFQFSGGQQQRIAIAIAIACRPAVLILDEPTTGLDVTTQARITQLLRELVVEYGIGCLYVSHDVALLGTLVDRLAIMYGGQIVEAGSNDTVARRHRHPYTEALLGSVPSVRRPRFVTGIPGRPPASVVQDACAYALRCPYVLPACTERAIPLSNRGTGHVVRCIRPNEADRVTRVSRELPPTLAVAGVLLEISDLWCEHPAASAPAVKGVSLAMAPAERVGIVGESGSGKTTLLRAIAGLHVPSHGTISFRGAPLAPQAVKRTRSLRKEIQLIFQNPDSSLNPRHSVLSLVGRPIRMFRDDVPRAQEPEVVQELLEAVKLPSGLIHRYPVELSGGQRQRVAIARAFAAQPALLLCDEITSALDVSVQATVLELIADLSVQTGTAVLWISHDLAVVRTIANRAIVMRDGEVCEEGSTEELFATPKHAYTRDLVAAIPELPVTQPPAVSAG